MNMMSAHAAGFFRHAGEEKFVMIEFVMFG